ncbi:MAG: hypothetical protein JNL97_07505 [Verrucomicrobiales bacterium]|nr:hypothetical protein [Verrucomicrobiales bacterium]
MIPLQSHHCRCRLVLAFAMLGLAIGCSTTRIQSTSPRADLSVPPATRVMVLFAGGPGPLRIGLEDALATELGRHAVTAERSLGKLDLAEFLADPVAVPRRWSARTGQSFLVLRPVDGEGAFESKDRRGIYHTGGPLPPTSVVKPKDRSMRETMNAHEFAAASGAPSVVPGYAMSEEHRIFEVAFLDPATGRALWTGRAMTLVRESTDEAKWMAKLAREIVGQLRREKLVP